MTKTLSQRLRNAAANPASVFAPRRGVFVLLGRVVVEILGDLQHGQGHTILTGQRREVTATGGMLDGRVGTPHHRARVQPDVRFFLTRHPERDKKSQ